MKALPIRILGDPVLRTPAEEVKEISEEVKRLAASMVATMFKGKGLGLAANQVGELKRICVLKTKVLDADVGIVARHFINPKILYMDGENEDEEGCLSIPGLYYPIVRPDEVVIQALELREGEVVPVEMEAKGLMARTILHEIDHLDGILFIDRLDMFTRASLIADWEKSRRTMTG